MASKTKICSRCGLEKPLSEFYKQAGGGQGRRGMCKECFRGAQRPVHAPNLGYRPQNVHTRPRKRRNQRERVKAKSGF